MNNKGFAITTILYVMMLLFLMLIVSLLGILSTYRSRLEMLQEGENGAREIIYSRYNKENIAPEIILSNESSGTYKVSLSSKGFKDGSYVVKYGRVGDEVTGCLSLTHTYNINVNNSERLVEIYLKDEDTLTSPFYVCIVGGIADMYGNVLSEEDTIKKED